MTPEQIKAIRQRNEERKATKAYVADPSDDHFVDEYILVDIDALLAEMDFWKAAANGMVFTAIQALNGNEAAQKILREAQAKRLGEVINPQLPKS